MSEDSFAWGTIALVTVFLIGYFGERRIQDRVPREIKSIRVLIWLLALSAWIVSLVLMEQRLVAGDEKTWLMLVVAMSGFRLIIVPPILLSSQFMSERGSRKVLFSISASSLVSFAPTVVSCTVLIALLVATSVAVQYAMSIGGG